MIVYNIVQYSISELSSEDNHRWEAREGKLGYCSEECLEGPKV